MAYIRPPNTVFVTGPALSSTPGAQPLDPAGVIPITITANIASSNTLGVVQTGGLITIDANGVIDIEVTSKTNLGVVQIGDNINVDANGVISVANTSITGSCCNVDVKLVTSNYTAKANDCYIGVKSSKGDDDDSPTSIIITLPLGVTGKQYIVKNQKSGNIKVQGTSGQTLDSSAFKTLGAEASLIAIFDGTRWNLV